jgi:hypothetical protein
LPVAACVSALAGREKGIIQQFSIAARMGREIYDHRLIIFFWRRKNRMGSGVAGGVTFTKTKSDAVIIHFGVIKKMRQPLAVPRPSAQSKGEP